MKITFDRKCMKRESEEERKRKEGVSKKVKERMR